MKTVLGLSVCLALPLAVVLSPVAHADTLQKAEVDGQLTVQQLNALSGVVRGCQSVDQVGEARIERQRRSKGEDYVLTERDMRNIQGFVRGCLLEKLGLDDRKIPRKNHALQEVYNGLVDHVNAESAQLKPGTQVIDGHHRAKAYATTTRDDWFCRSEEWIQVAFDEEEMRDRPIRLNTMETIVSGAFLTTIAQSPCVNEAPKTVSYVFTVGNDVVLEKTFEPEYGFVFQRRTVDKNHARAFGKEIGQEVLDAVYAER